MTNPSAPAGGADSTTGLSVFDIFPNPWNPHRMTEQEQNDLIQSVRDGGQWRPVLVVEMDVPDEYTPGTPPAPYRIVDGFHLWTALTALVTEGSYPDTVRVMVIGKNSELDAVQQMDIGQTINHGLRGSIEDPVKTQQVLDKLLTRRAPEEVARRMNIGTAGVRHLSTGPSRLPVHTPTVATGTLSGAVHSTPYAERKLGTLALVFNSAQEMKDFEASLEHFAHLLDPSVNYHNKRGQRRIDLIRAVMLHAQLLGTAGAS